MQLHFSEQIKEELITANNLRLNNNKKLLKELIVKIDQKEIEKEILVRDIESLWQKGFLRGSLTYRNEIYLEINRPITAGNKHKTIYFGPNEELNEKINGKTNRVYVGNDPERKKFFIEMLKRYKEIEKLLGDLNSLQSILGYSYQALKSAKSWL